MLIAAKKVASTERIAVRVQADLANFWLANAKDPNDIFRLLKLNKDGDKLYDSSLFSSWLKYLDDFNVMHPKEEQTAMITLTEHYSSSSLVNMIIKATQIPSTESIATKFQTQLLDYWLQSGKTPVYLQVVEAERSRRCVVRESNFQDLADICHRFQNGEPSQKLGLVSILSRYFKDDALAKMIIKAEKVPSTNALALDLLDQFTIRWMYYRKYPAMVYKWLGVQGAAKDDPIRKFYIEYARLYKIRMGEER